MRVFYFLNFVLIILNILITMILIKFEFQHFKDYSKYRLILFFHTSKFMSYLKSLILAIQMLNLIFLMKHIYLY